MFKEIILFNKNMQTIQTVIFDKNVFTIAQAGIWLKINNFYTDDQGKRMNVYDFCQVVA